jgi:hypothetical protein
MRQRFGPQFLNLDDLSSYDFIKYTPIIEMGFLGIFPAAKILNR